MINFVLFLLFLTSLTQSVHSSECYVTDLTAIEAKNIDAVPIEKNCKDFFDFVDVDDDILNDNFRCYTVKAYSDRATINLQGCTITDNCQSLKNKVEKSLAKFDQYYDVSCEDCIGNLCNSGVKHSIIIKRWYHVKSIVITLVIIFGIISIGTTVICYFRNRKSVNSYSQFKG